MTIFKLPDLGEGLPDAEIHAWYIKVGDSIAIDQPLVAMETAKAIVDVPSPITGIIEELCGKPGDVIKTGQSLVVFKNDDMANPDAGTVVGQLKQAQYVSHETFKVGGVDRPLDGVRVRTTPAVRLLAKQLSVDLTKLHGTGVDGLITQQDVESYQNICVVADGYEPLRGGRKAMCHSMVQAHQAVVPVSLYDEVDIHAWPPGTDLTIRLIQAMIVACKHEPALNAWFNAQSSARKCFENIHLGLAVDSNDGLFVPVIHNAEQKNSKELRQIIQTFKQQILSRSLPTADLHGATITLSNFGRFAGRFASPIIVPPQVAILAVGRIYSIAAQEHSGVVLHPALPLSLTFDHRVITGGEATRFLRSLQLSLEEVNSENCY